MPFDGGITEAAIAADALGSAAAAGGTAAASTAAGLTAADLLGAGTLADAGTLAGGGILGGATAADLAGTGAAAAGTGAALGAAADLGSDAGTTSIFLAPTDATSDAGIGSAITGGGAQYGPPELVGAGGSPVTGAASAIYGPPELVGPTGSPVAGAAGGVNAPNGAFSVGHYLSQAGKLLGPTGTASSALQTLAKTMQPPQGGNSATVRPGSPGAPRGGEQQLAALVQAMLNRRNQYIMAQQQPQGAPLLYNPAGLLGF